MRLPGVVVFTTFAVGLCAFWYANGEPRDAVAFLPIIGFLLLCDVMIYRGDRRRVKQVSRLGQVLEAGSARNRGGLFTYRRVEGYFRERKAGVTITDPGGKGLPGHLIIHMACASPLRSAFDTATRGATLELRGGYLRWEARHREHDDLELDTTRAVLDRLAQLAASLERSA